MRCPRCTHPDDRVVDSRQARDGSAIRRRRECLECGFRYTTYETVELTLPLVVKSDERREPFDRNKVRSALRIACQKRPVDAQTIEAVVDRVELKIAGASEREVDARAIGDMLVTELRDIDGVAWLRFASVYHSFNDIQEFLAAVESAAGDKA